MGKAMNAKTMVSAGVVVAFGAILLGQPTASVKPPDPDPYLALAQAHARPVQVGRYQIVYSPQLARDTFLLDTSSGRTWQIFIGKDADGDEHSGWQPVLWRDAGD